MENYGTDCNVTNTHNIMISNDGVWPKEAQEIMDNAGAKF